MADMKIFPDIFILAMIIVNIYSCSKKSKQFSSLDAGGGAAVTSENLESEEGKNEKVAVIPVAIDNRPIEDVLCQEGPKLIAAAKKADFSPQFQVICDGSTTSSLFKDAILSAYQGSGEPLLKIVKSTNGADFVTQLAWIYAIKVPLANPSMFADYKPHDIFSAGVRSENSELFINVESRAAFPGKASVEQVVLNYDLKLANGASIFDKRRSEFNTYLLVEGNRDIVLSTEHLLEAETNEYYHSAQGFIVGMKADDNHSYLIFVSDITIKNRIDPARMKRTLISLNIAVAKMLQGFVMSKTVR
ncbi:MAG: hypothetical protein NTX25_02800 [Proteobacteria bacterium]|nr:hypothetical protein [Pseudomonadota bacterium]